jgi:hypothetical protein
MPLVLGLCDPVVVLAAGRPIAQGPPRAIQRDPLVLGAYLGGDGQQTERLAEGSGEPRGPEGSGEPQGGAPVDHPPVDHPPVAHPPVGREV